MTDPLFDLRTPPRGGLDRLARAIAQSPRRRWTAPAAALGGALCVALAVTLHVRESPRRAFEAALQQAIVQSEMPARGDTLREVPSGRDDVRILLLPVGGD